MSEPDTNTDSPEIEEFGDIEQDYGMDWYSPARSDPLFNEELDPP